MVYIFNDEGFIIGIFIHKQTGVDDDLLALCAEYAVMVPASQFSRFSGFSIHFPSLAYWRRKGWRPMGEEQ
ncbi:hypothetical protein AAW31_10795 [Nitrosomonas communis]|uniref:Uncharacterized protein n=1 Tax=Nitrosomonas communis TaxID=44574 RepID=A0A0F7KFA1_9PROT|nr:hypothetical protein AAW31_10795 [Nitrosomonas communis]